MKPESRALKTRALVKTAMDGPATLPPANAATMGGALVGIAEYGAACNGLELAPEEIAAMTDSVKSREGPDFRDS